MSTTEWKEEKTEQGAEKGDEEKSKANTGFRRTRQRNANKPKRKAKRNHKEDEDESEGKDDDAVEIMDEKEHPTEYFQPLDPEELSSKLMTKARGAAKKSDKQVEAGD